MKSATTFTLVLATVFAAGAIAAKEDKKAETETKNAETQPKKTKEETKEDLTLKGGEEGTIFKSLRIEGEDRVRIEFERPRLDPDLDPYSAPGLDWENFHSVLDRGGVELTGPYLARSAMDRHPYYARPWLSEFSTGDVIRFRPALDGVERWRLSVANSKGETFTSFEGKGKPPKELAWDGRSQKGQPVAPGYTYSYVLEAFDKAGNKRNFVGDGFEIPSYRLHTPDGIAFLFAGEALVHDRPEVGGEEPASAAVLEAASWINQQPSSTQVVRIEVTAQTFDDANRIAAALTEELGSLLIGDQNRIQAITNVVPDAPDRGTIAIVVTTRKDRAAN